MSDLQKIKNFTLPLSTHHPPPQAVGVLAELHVRTWDSHCLTLWASTLPLQFISFPPGSMHPGHQVG